MGRHRIGSASLALCRKALVSVCVYTLDSCISSGSQQGVHSSAANDENCGNSMKRLVVRLRFDFQFPLGCYFTDTTRSLALLRFFTSAYMRSSIVHAVDLDDDTLDLLEPLQPVLKLLSWTPLEFVPVHLGRLVTWAFAGRRSFLFLS